MTKQQIVERLEGLFERSRDDVMRLELRRLILDIEIDDRREREGQ